MRALKRTSPAVDLWLYLLPLGTLFDIVGYVSRPLGAGIVLALLALPLCRCDKGSAAGAAGLLAAMALRAWLPLPPVADRLLLLAAHQWVWRRSDSVPAGVTAGVVAYAGLHLLLFESPHGLAPAEALATLGNRLVAALAGTRVAFGPTYHGTGALLLFLCLSLFAWRRGGRIAIARSLAGLAVMALLTALLAALMLDKVAFDADLTWKFSYREPVTAAALLERMSNLGVLLFPLLHFTAFLAVYATLHGSSWRRQTGQPGPPGADQPPQPLPPSSMRLRIAAPLLLLGLIATATPQTAWRRPAPPPEVVFIEQGVVSFSKPDDNRFGRGAGGMFGMLPEYTRLFGSAATVTKEIPETLDPERQVLMFTNLDAPIAEADRTRIWDFVAEGGGLWVLGDHTFIKNDRHHINDLLEPCDIRFENDSAQFFPQGWFHSYRFAQGTPFGHLTENGDNRPAWLVGASLALRGPARPLIIGRFGYGDLGTETPDPQRGHLGDFTFQPHERLGDLVLAAGQPFGRGRVLVFADTTSFFNHAMPRAYELLQASLSWFGERPATRWPPAGHVARLLAIALLAGLWAALSGGACRATALACCLAGAAYAIAAHQPGRGLLPWDPEVARARVVLIDFSHHPDASRHGNMPTGLHGVPLSLMRRGYLPVEPSRWSAAELQQSAAVVLNAPRTPLSARARTDLRRFLEGGGNVFMTCGHHHEPANRRLLEEFGLRVRNLPLGRFFDRQAFGQRISFFSAWPIEYENPATAVLCVYDDWPLVVSVPVGQGRFVLIGDSEFLQNRNLESSDRHDPANVRFLRTLFSRIGEEPHPW